MKPSLDQRTVVIALAVLEGIALTAVICLALWK